jgi:hypothetical protein
LVGPATALLVAAWSLVVTGCVSSKYKLARPDETAPQPPTLKITAADPAVSATLHTVVVFHGPGSWKKDAYWDEYVLTVSALGTENLMIDRVELVDVQGSITPAGYDVWKVDAASRERLRVARHTGRGILLGAGAGAVWLGSLGLFASNLTIYGGVVNTTAATVGAAGVVAIPAIALGSGVRTLVARSKIAKEFDRRRIVLPAQVPAGSSRSGSFFFPVTPAPAHLQLRCRDGTGADHTLRLELTPLARLHLAPARSDGAAPDPRPRRSPPS